jgi:hypothetical protein
MSVIYNTSSYTPMVKLYNTQAADAVGTVTVWTPASGKRVGLTDVVLSGAASATMALYYGPADGTVAQTLIFAHSVRGSTVVKFHFDTPIQVPTVDYCVRMTSNSGGFRSCTLLGYEQ